MLDDGQIWAAVGMSVNHSERIASAFQHWLLVTGRRSRALGLVEVQDRPGPWALGGGTEAWCCSLSWTIFRTRRGCWPIAMCCRRSLPEGSKPRTTKRVRRLLSAAVPCVCNIRAFIRRCVARARASKAASAGSRVRILRPHLQPATCVRLGECDSLFLGLSRVGNRRCWHGTTSVATCCWP